MDENIERIQGAVTPPHSLGEYYNGDGASFGFSMRRDPPFLFVALRGELDLNYYQEVGAQLSRELSDRTYTDMVVDMGGLDLIDSSGLSVLINAMHTLYRRGGTVHLVRCRPQVLRTLAVTRLDRIFPVHNSAPDLCTIHRRAAGTR